MKKIVLIFAILGLAYAWLQQQDFFPSIPPATSNGNAMLRDAYANRRSDLQVSGTGTVARVLNDDVSGSRHQRFILNLGPGQTILVSHNIDLAPRIDDLKPGDNVEFYGEYEWNARGGVIHWTHHDPQGRHVAGWLKHQNKTYQ